MAHDLRRTYGSIDVDSGQNEAVVDALLGHSRGRIRDTYLLRSDPVLAQVAEGIGTHIAGLFGLLAPAQDAHPALEAAPSNAESQVQMANPGASGVEHCGWVKTEAINVADPPRLFVRKKHPDPFTVMDLDSRE